MSEYTHINAYGDTLGFKQSLGVPDEMLLSVQVGSAYRGMHIPKAHVPTVAAELLKASGQESVIVPRSTKPVEVRQFDQLRCGDAATHAEEDPAKLRGLAADFIAIAEYIESKAIREADAEKKLQERRDALSFQLNGGGVELLRVPYANRTATMRQAIDRIIELEDGK